ncbi:hypothetical protein PAHAL_3G066600 [Panicum hallii]|jgi:hypothetical protein|uniref:Dirigent protein n=1 Tax=Panicum hallii TaxID=206008 RepID=A0A2S3H6P1_9POAL|nr:uncharacterized protein LOC112886526 [Panicum hallii]PAN16526.1 hypothetical protein PAHAL_3G066600 [Panicum hallii]
MANFQITPSRVTVENTEYSFSNLYLFQTPLDPNRNQFGVTSSDAATGPGAIVVNNWPIYDGAGPGATVVARAQGLHIHAGNWNNVFSIVFENQRFHGSTLEVMGISVEHGEHAIVGGTGQFAMARGVIYKKFHEPRSDGNIIQLTIRGFFPVLKRSPQTSRVIKKGPYGGNGGVAWDITDTPSRLESITIHYGGVIDGIEFSYFDQYDQKHTTGRWGGSGGTSTRTIELAPSEFVKEVFGTIGSYSPYNNIIRTLAIVTNVRTYGPFGNPRNGTTPFSIPAQNNGSIVGFFARGMRFLDAIGVYVQETQI